DVARTALDGSLDQQVDQLDDGCGLGRPPQRAQLLRTRRLCTRARPRIAVEAAGQVADRTVVVGILDRPLERARRYDDGLDPPTQAEAEIVECCHVERIADRNRHGSLV